MNNKFPIFITNDLKFEINVKLVFFFNIYYLIFFYCDFKILKL